VLLGMTSLKYFHNRLPLDYKKLGTVYLSYTASHLTLNFNIFDLLSKFAGCACLWGNYSI
jgi:hypothetical protein